MDRTGKRLLKAIPPECGATCAVKAPRMRVESDTYAVKFLGLGISQVADTRYL